MLGDIGLTRNKFELVAEVNRNASTFDISIIVNVFIPPSTAPLKQNHGIMRTDAFHIYPAKTFTSWLHQVQHPQAGLQQPPLLERAPQGL